MTNDRGLRRRVPVESWRRMACGLAAAALIALALPVAPHAQPGTQAGATGSPPPAGQQRGQQGGQPASTPQDPQAQRPVFRAGASAVRVDVYATRKGVPVEDLTADDFEVLEDNVTQKIEAFEHIKIETGGDPTTRVEPRNVRDSNQMAADPRSRLFVLFLDFYHVHQSASFNVTRPLMNLMDKLVGDQDLMAVMTPDMSARGLMFTRRTDQIADMLASFKWWGQRGREGSSDDPVEQMYVDCYPPAAGVGGMTSQLAMGMIERRREKLTLDALEDLVIRLGGLREERKAILLVSEGWRLFRPDPSMQASTSTQPITRDPTGRILGTNPNNTGIYSNNRQCEQDRVMLSGIDDDRRFRDIMDLANRSNASFYPIEPRGLPVFDTEMGPNYNPSVIDDFNMLQERKESLMTIAANTDGVAVINSNDISGGLKRVVSDLSSYYLLGYTSTNSKLDGRYRAIKVRVKRPGIEIRARNGYKAPTADEAAMMVAASAPVVIDPATAAISKAIGSLEGTAREAPIRISVSPGWWTPAGDPSKGKPAGAEPALWIMGEVDAKSRTGDDWSQGGEADVAITGGNDQTPLVRYTVPIPPGVPRFLTRFPRTLDDIWLDPGTYSVRVRVKAATGGIPITDSAKFDVASPAKADTLMVGPPIYMRRGSAASSPEQPTSDRRYRRTERIVVLLSTTLAPDKVSADLLDRSGKVMPLPVTAAVVEKDSVRWVRSELQLAPLGLGDYLLRLTTEKGASKIQMLAPFRIVP